jgi:hypothetical protein
MKYLIGMLVGIALAAALASLGYAQTPIQLAPGTYQACGPSNVTIVIGACGTPTPTTTPVSTRSPTPAPTATPKPPTPTPVAVSTPSPSGTVSMAGSGSSIRDNAGNVWAINSGAHVTINGIQDGSTLNVIELAYVNGILWHENTSKLWYGKSSPTAPWLPAAGTLWRPVL